MRPPAIRFVVTDNHERLDRLIADATGSGRRAVREWLRAGAVRLDGRVASGSDAATAGSEVVIEAGSLVVAEDRDDDGSASTVRADWRPIVETEGYLVVAKPAGLHCVRGRTPGSLAELVQERYGDLTSVGDDAAEAGLVHRIDRDTSGVVVIARTRSVWLQLRAAFRAGRTRKSYLALVAGALASAREIDLPLARRGVRMAPAGRHDVALEAETRVEPLEGGDDWTLVRATMTTGAMHQVRVHLAAIGHPLFGDATYDGPALHGYAGRPRMREGQLLHAMRVEIDGTVDVSAGPPEDFLAACALLRQQSAGQSGASR
jgi:23S rRNA pseudouridine1911/1915/1917 synthase